MVPTKFGIKCLLRFVQCLLVFGALANAQFNIQNSGLNERGCGHVGQTTPKVCTVSQAMQSNGVNFNGLVVAFAARPQSNGVNFKVHNVKFGDDYMEKAAGLDYDGMFPTDTTPKTNGWMSVYYIGGNHLEGVTRDISYTLTPDANKEIGKVVWSRILVRGAKGIVPLKLFQGGGVPGTQSKTITNTLYDTYGKSVNAQWFGFMFFRKEAQADCGTCFNVPGGSKNTEIKAKSNLGFGTSKVTSGETDGEVTFTWEHTFDNSPYGHAVFAVYRDKSPCENPNFSCGANGACKNTFYNDCLCKNGYKGPFCQYGPQQMYIHDNAFRKRRYIESPDANTNAIQIKHSMPPRKYSYPCTFLEDIELLGENFVGGFLNIVNTTGECCQLCQSYKDCKAWKFDKSDASVATRGQCWLQKTVGARRESPASGTGQRWDSGIRYDAERDYNFVWQYKGQCDPAGTNNDDWAYPVTTGTASSFKVPARHSIIEGTGRSKGMKSCYDQCKTQFDPTGASPFDENFNDGYQGGINVQFTNSQCYCMKQKSCPSPSTPDYRTFSYREKIAPAKALYVATCTRNSHTDGNQAKVDRVYVNGPGITINGDQDYYNGLRMTEVKNELVSDSSTTYDVTEHFTQMVPSPSAVNVPSPSEITSTSPSPSGNETVSVSTTSYVQVSYETSVQISVPTPSQREVPTKYTNYSRRLQIFKLVGGLGASYNSGNSRLEGNPSETEDYFVNIHLNSVGQNAGGVAVMTFSAEDLKGTNDLDSTKVFGNVAATATKSTLNETDANKFKKGGLAVDFACFNAFNSANGGFMYHDSTQQNVVTDHDTQLKGRMDVGFASSVREVSAGGQSLGFHWSRGSDNSDAGAFHHTMVHLVDELTKTPNGAPTLTLDSSGTTATVDSMKANLTLSISNTGVTNDYPSETDIGLDIPIQYLGPYFGGEPHNKIIGFIMEYKETGASNKFILHNYVSMVNPEEGGSTDVPKDTFDILPTSYFFGHLKAGTQYSFRMAYESTQGFGDYSQTFDATTPTQSTKQNLANFAVSRTGAKECTISWDAPSGTNRHGFKYYYFQQKEYNSLYEGRVYGYDETANIYSIVQNKSTIASPYKPENLNAKSTYDFSLAYVNDAGVGGVSEGRCAPHSVVAASSSTFEDRTTLSFYTPYVNSGANVVSTNFALRKRLISPTVFSVSLNVESPMASSLNNGSLGGQYRLVVDGQYSNCINWDDSGAGVESAIEAIPSVKKVRVTRNDLSSRSRVWKVTFLDKVDGTRKVEPDFQYQPNERLARAVVIGNGTNRTYHFWRLTNTSDPAPVLFYFHSPDGGINECRNDGWVQLAASSGAHAVCLETTSASESQYFEWKTFRVNYKLSKQNAWKIPHILTGESNRPSTLTGNFDSGAGNKCDMNLASAADLSYVNETWYDIFKIPGVQIDTSKAYLLGKKDGADMAMYVSQCMQSTFQAVGTLFNGLNRVSIYDDKWTCHPYSSTENSASNFCVDGEQSHKNGHLGCWNENPDYPVVFGYGADNALRVVKGSSGAMTVETCRTECSEYLYFGIKNGTQCFCDNRYDTFGRAAGEFKCSIPCTGDASTMCGGRDGDRREYVSVFTTAQPALQPNKLRDFYYPVPIVKNDNQQHCHFYTGGGNSVAENRAKLQLNVSQALGQSYTMYQMDNCLKSTYDRAYNKEVWGCITGGSILDIGKAVSSNDDGAGEEEPGAGAGDGGGSGVQAAYDGKDGSLVFPKCHTSIVAVSPDIDACYGFPIKSDTYETDNLVKVSNLDTGSVTSTFENHTDFIVGDGTSTSLSTGTLVENFYVNGLLGDAVYEFQIDPNGNGFGPGSLYSSTAVPKAPGEFPAGIGKFADNNGPASYACPGGMVYAKSHPSANPQCFGCSTSTGSLSNCASINGAGYCRDSAGSVDSGYCESRGPDFCDLAWWRPVDNNGAEISSYDIYKCECVSSSNVSDETCDSDGCLSNSSATALNDAKWVKIGSDDVIIHSFHKDYNGSHSAQRIGTYASVEGLKAQTRYRFMVSAKNAVGSNRNIGHDNMLPSCFTKGVEKPGKPFGVSARSIFADSITMGWKINSTGGANVTYTIEINKCTVENCSTSTPVKPYNGTANVLKEHTFTDLEAETRYFIKVRAANSGSNSPSDWSEGAVVITSVPSVAEAPSNVQWVNISGGVGFLSWEAPKKKGGTGVTGYQIEIQKNGTDTSWNTVVANTASGSTLHRIGNLFGSVAYKARIKTINRIGLSATHSAESPTMSSGTATVPSQIETKPAFNNPPPTEKQITITWSLPFTHGGAEISGFRIQYKNQTRGSTDSGIFRTLVDNTNSNAQTFTMGSSFISLGTMYAFKVAALNEIGEGAYSNQSEWTKRITIEPSQISQPPVASNVKPTTLTLSWTSPEYDGGCDIKSYRISRRIDSTGAFEKLVDTESSATTAEVVDLLPGRVYEFRVQALNSDDFLSVPSLASGKTESTAKLSIKLIGEETTASFSEAKRETLVSAISVELEVPKAYVRIVGVSSLTGGGRRRRLASTNGLQVDFEIVNVTAVDAISAAAKFDTVASTSALVSQLQESGLNITSTSTGAAVEMTLEPTEPTTGEATIPDKMQEPLVINSLDGPTTAHLSWVKPTFAQSGGADISNYRIKAFIAAPAQQIITVTKLDSPNAVPNGKFRIVYRGNTSRCMDWNVTESALKQAIEATYSTDFTSQASAENATTTMAAGGDNATTTTAAPSATTAAGAASSILSIEVTRSGNGTAVESGIENLLYSWTVTFKSPEGDLPLLNLTANSADNACSEGISGAAMNILHYVQGVSKADAKSAVVVPYTATPSTSYTLANLIPGRRYAFFVAAVNEFGIGPYSDVSAWEWTGAPDAPTKPTVVPYASNIGYENMTVNWQSANGHGLSILGYRVWKRSFVSDVQVVSFYSDSALSAGSDTLTLSFSGESGNTSCLAWDASPAAIGTALKDSLGKTASVTRSSSGNFGYRWTIRFDGSHGHVKELKAEVCAGSNVPTYSSGHQLRVEKILDGHESAWEILHGDTGSQLLYSNVTGLNHSSVYLFKVAAISHAGVGTESDSSANSGTLSSKNCVLSDWSPWGDCAILREEDYSCGEEVCGENANGVRRCGRLSCTGEDVSLLDEGTVSLNKEKFVLRFQSRSRALLEKPENGGTGCINGVLNEARPCCTSTEKGYVAQISAFEGAVKTCNGTDWV